MSVTPDNLDLGRGTLDRGDEGERGFKPKKGSSEEILREMSGMKGEPDWMLDIRLTSYRHFEKRPMPNWGGDLSDIRFDGIFSGVDPTDGRAKNWEDLPATVGGAHGAVDSPGAGQTKYQAGVAARYESDVVLQRRWDELERQGVLFTDMETAVRQHPELVKEHFGKIVPMNDNKFSALNTSVWSGGSFIYVPPGVEVEMPLQVSPRATAVDAGRFERTLVIADEGSKVHYIEGCSAPVYASDSLHAAVVEVVVKPSAHVTYTTIQNWSSNVFNLGTKRAIVGAEGHMAWIDGNIGSRLTMKYPAAYLVGPKATGEALSVAYAGKGQHQDTGAKMVHAAPETTSKIVARSISKDGGRSSYRGLVRVEGNAYGCRSHVRCDALMLDGDSNSDFYPSMEIGADDAEVDHEMTVSRVAEEQLFYLMSRGLSKEQATGLVVNGFIEPVTRTLPMEYAVEWSRLVELQMEGSVG